MSRKLDRILDGLPVRSAATALTPADTSRSAARLVHLPHRSIDCRRLARISDV